MLVYFGGPQVLKRAEIYQKLDFFAMKQKSLLKPCFHRFWHDYNLSKHLPVEFANFLQWEGVLVELKMQEMLPKAL